jgi:hypothetical protein
MTANTVAIIIACVGAIGPIASLLATTLGKGRAAGAAHIVAGIAPDIVKVTQGVLQVATGNERVPTQVIPDIVLASDILPPPPLPKLNELRDRTTNPETD